MKQGNQAVAIAAQCIAHEAGLTPEMSLEDRLRAVMKVGREHWMITDEDERFRASVGAALMSATDEEQEQIKTELHALRDFSALCSGIPIDVSRIVVPENPVGLLALWKEVNAPTAEGVQP